MSEPLMHRLAEPPSSPFHTRRRALLPSALVLVSLLSLAIIPMITMRRTTVLHDRISNLSEPARSLVTQVQNALALESASTRAFLLTGDQQAVEDHNVASTNRQRALERLGPLAARLGPLVMMRYRELEARMRPTDALLDSLFSGAIPRQEFPSSLELQQRRLQDALGAAANLDRAIGRVSAASVADLQVMERVTAAITVALVLLAIVAAVLVVRLGRQYRLLAMRLGQWSRQQQASIRIAHLLNEATSTRDVVDVLANDTASAAVLRCEMRFQRSDDPEYVSNERRLVVSVASEGRTIGQMIFHRGRRARPFGDSEIAYVSTLRELVSATVHRIALLEALGESEKRFRQIAEAIHDSVWLSDAAFSTYLFVNSSFERIWGRKREALYSNPMAVLEGVHPDDRDRVRAALEKLPREAYDIEFRIMRPDGQQRWVWSRAFPVLNDRGQVYRMAGITEDITDRKLAAESRTRLIRGFTHDVKNPLGAADGFLALMQDEIFGTLNDKQKDSVGRARNAIRSALNLISNLLDIARAEAGQLDVERAPVDVGAVVRDITEEFRAEAETKKLDLSARVAGVGPENALTVETDSARVRQILANLLSNALKYTHPGGRVDVEVELRSDGEAPSKGEWVAVAVKDTGSGIPPDKQGLLFREFTRFDPGAAEGAGIGLAISQRVANALDAAITVKSELNVGSIFTLWLPRARSRRPPLPVPAARTRASGKSSVA